MNPARFAASKISDACAQLGRTREVSSTMPNATDPPECLLLAVCTDVIEDKQTNNKTLVNLFNSIAAPVVPTVQPVLALIASVTGVHEKATFRFEVHGPDDAIICKVEGETRCPDPVQVSDLVVKIVGLPLKLWGRYTVNLWMNGTYRASRFFDVKQIQLPEVQQ